jgi:hypothetical protein
VKRYIVILFLLFLTSTVGFLFIRQQPAYKERLDAAVAGMPTVTAKDRAVLSCRVGALQQRTDYPAVIKNMSVDEIKSFIQKQLARC